jgi:hypothetical protein
MTIRQMRRFSWALLAVATPCLATDWVEIGQNGPNGDTLLVDRDSLRIRDEFRVLEIVTRFPQPRPNVHGVTLDRIVQTTAFDCKKRAYAYIRTVGYLGEQRVASSPDAEGWQQKMNPLPDDSLTTRIFAIACPEHAAN